MAVETYKRLDTVSAGDGSVSICERELTDHSFVYDIVFYDKNGNEVFALYPIKLTDANTLFEAIKNYGS